MVQTDVSILSGVTGDTRASETTKKRIPRNKRKTKSLATSPPINIPIQNQDNNTLCIEKDKSIPQHVAPFSPGFKSLRNEANDDNT